MIVRPLLLAAVALAATPAPAATPGTIAAKRWHQRVVLISSADPKDPRIALQRRILAEWQGAGDRDIALVTVAGPRVDGVTDPAVTLRQRYGLAGKGFQALLIGKDGHVAMRSAAPIDAGTLQGAIDAMPMRQAGER